MAVKAKTTAAGHTAGIFADMTLDGPEIGTLVAVIDRAKNLPNRKTMGKQDPYCAMRLGKEAKKTDTDRRGGQTPKWDQELRFTVHESPDYYKLKCSIFNDDKRTDLIGEAWIDLSDLIRPGGGSNDLWHGLNYKGKYAGEVRIELTYYDLRPRDEMASEKKKQREKASSPAGDIANLAPVQRQLGPREVRRRPLPASPGAPSPAAASPAQTPPVQTPQKQPAEPPPPPPKIPVAQEEKSYTPPKSQRRREEPCVMDPYVDDSSNAHQSPHPILQSSRTQPAQQYRQPFCEDQISNTEYQEEPSWTSSYDQQPSKVHQSPYASIGPSPISLSQTSWHDDSEDWEQSIHRTSHQHTPSDLVHYESPHSLPSPPAHSTEQPYFSSRSNTSPVKPIPHRDSPLRHSISHQDVPMHMVGEPESYDMSPPPPPPMHRESATRRQHSEYPPSSFSQFDQSVVPFAPRPLDVTSRRRSVDERSPLQTLEYEYDSYLRNEAPNSDRNERQGSFDSYQDTPSRYRHHSDRSIDHYADRRGSVDNYHHQSSSIPTPEQRTQESLHNNESQEPAYRKSMYRDGSSSYDDHRLSQNFSSIDDHYAVIPHSSSQPNLPQPEYHKPQLVRPRPNSSSPGYVPQRKAVSPTPYSQHDGQQPSAVPFNPDAYNVLNPASSPGTNHQAAYQTYEQTKETARMREVTKLRDQGPIIGNDGRVIDPSDHLPSDTWAPEPDRKARRPEHVIHYRTKNDARSRATPSSSPASTRMAHKRQPPLQSPSNSVPNSTPPSNNRTRLQKQTPNRPLPSQPHQEHVSEPRPKPRVEHGPGEASYNQQALQRYPYQGSPSGIHRPQLSEYQIPVEHQYTSQNSSYQNDYPVHQPQPPIHTRREYNPRNSNFFDDPLAAELSMIDIGPSRGGQMVLSSRRGY